MILHGIEYGMALVLHGIALVLHGIVLVLHGIARGLYLARHLSTIYICRPGHIFLDSEKVSGFSIVRCSLVSWWVHETVKNQSVPRRPSMGIDWPAEHQEESPI